MSETIGASSPLVLLIVRTRAFFRCPSPEDATVRVIVFSSSSSTLARFVTAMPGPEGGGSLRTDMFWRCRRECNHSQTLVERVAFVVSVTDLSVWRPSIVRSRRARMELDINASVIYEPIMRQVVMEGAETMTCDGSR